MGKRTKLYSNISSRRSPFKRLSVNNSCRYFNAQILHVSAEKLRASDKVPESCAKGFYKEKKNLRLKLPWIWTSLLGKKLCLRLKA